MNYAKPLDDFSDVNLMPFTKNLTSVKYTPQAGTSHQSFDKPVVCQQSDEKLDHKATYFKPKTVLNNQIIMLLYV